MSFSIKKRTDDIFYISQNSATTNPSSDNWSESGNNIYNNNTGNVGINTSSPSFDLDVSGNVKVNTLFYSSLNPSLDASGFMTARSLSPGQNLIGGSTKDIIFNYTTDGSNGVLMNGWTYDPVTRYFNCPSAGKYLVNASITTSLDSGGSFEQSLYINSIPALSTPIFTLSGKPSNTGGQTNLCWLFNLSQNDKIYLSASVAGSVEPPGPYSAPVANAYLTIIKI